MRLIDADDMAERLEHDVELDARALDSTDLVGPERERVQFDKDCKQNCMWYLTEQPTVPAPRWVRCEDALPEIGQRVIVYDGWMQFMTRKDDQRIYGKMYWENEEGNWERVDDEAYWMPIEPPKEDA